MVGMWKAFGEMEQIGWLQAGQRPKMVTVQPEGCPPIVNALERGADTAGTFEHAHTVADGLRVPRAIADFLILRIIRESGGTAVAVSDRQMVDDMLTIGKLEGVSAAPEGAASLSAVRKLVADGRIKKHETVVLFNTGGALKYLDLLR
jgi:threonine synthase